MNVKGHMNLRKTRKNKYFKFDLAKVDKDK